MKLRIIYFEPIVVKSFVHTLNPTAIWDEVCAVDCPRPVPDPIRYDLELLFRHNLTIITNNFSYQSIHLSSGPWKRPFLLPENPL